MQTIGAFAAVQLALGGMPLLCETAFSDRAYISLVAGTAVTRSLLTAKLKNLPEHLGFGNFGKQPGREQAIHLSQAVDFMLVSCSPYLVCV